MAYEILPEKVKSQSYQTLHYIVKYILQPKLYFIFYLLIFKIQHFASKLIIYNTSASHKPSIKFSFLYYNSNTTLKSGKTNFELTVFK